MSRTTILLDQVHETADSPSGRVRPRQPSVSPSGPSASVKRARHDRPGRAKTPSGPSTAPTIQILREQAGARLWATNQRPAAAPDDDLLHLPEFAPNDFRPHYPGRAFLQTHGVVCVRLEPDAATLACDDVQMLVARVNRDLQARGVTTQGLDDPHLQARIRGGDPSLPLQLRTTRLGSGHVREPPAQLPLLEAGLTLDRVGQSREAWALRAQTAPVFDALFNLPPPSEGGDEPLLADSMPMGLAVAGQQCLVSALRPQVPGGTDGSRAPDAGSLYNALRPLRAHGVMQIVPGLHLLCHNRLLARSDVRAYVESMRGYSAPAPAGRVPIALRPGCVYLWSRSTWCALSVQGGAPPVLVQYQRFRHLRGVNGPDVSELRERQRCFVAHARGTGRSRAECIDQAGLRRVRTDSPPDPSYPWRHPDEVTETGRRDKLLPPYADRTYRFPTTPQTLMPGDVAVRPLSLIGGCRLLLTPGPPGSQSMTDVLRALLSTELGAEYDALCEKQAAIEAERARARAARAAEAADEDIYPRICSAHVKMHRLLEELRTTAGYQDFSMADLEQLMTASLLDPDETVVVEFVVGGAPSRVHPPWRVHGEEGVVPVEFVRTCVVCGRTVAGPRLVANLRHVPPARLAPYRQRAGVPIACLTCLFRRPRLWQLWRAT